MSEARQGIIIGSDKIIKRLTLRKYETQETQFLRRHERSKSEASDREGAEFTHSK